MKSEGVSSFINNFRSPHVVSLRSELTKSEMAGFFSIFRYFKVSMALIFSQLIIVSQSNNNKLLIRELSTFFQVRSSFCSLVLFSRLFVFSCLSIIDIVKSII